MPTSPSAVNLPLSKYRNFNAVLGSAAVSSLGDGVRLAALPLLVVTITSDPVAVSGVAIANRLPWIFVALFSGAIADRYRRRTLIIVVDAARATVVLALAALIFLHADTLTMVYVVAVGLGIGETLFDSASQGFLPDLVPAEHLSRANSRLFTVRMVGSNFLGPTIGSWLFGISRMVPFIADSISFAVGSMLVGTVKNQETHQPQGKRKSLLHDVRAGISWLWRHPLIRSFAIVVTLVNFTQSASQSLLVLLAVDDLGISKNAYGLLLTAGGVGGFIGGMLSPRIGDRLGVPYILWPAIALTCPLFFVMAWTRQPVMLGAALASNAFLGILANVQMISLRQRLVPRNYLGRVGSVNQFLSFGLAIPIGALAAGLLAHWTSVRTVYLAAAVAVLVLSLGVMRQMRPAAIKQAIAEVENEPAGESY
ncbi:hypothetical protein GTS_56760 [Gandjariella thermophila]|uniref:Major facilitator superfamily (MFS) profile domain-containing protein n=2 Tax=Gandjariella thermophila TaxID=1931992 RepID=A0A4D4JJF8_9PSEU|nr:hypothetical protein GTS_56760 [Gandjariella thermophila]